MVEPSHSEDEQNSLRQAAHDALRPWSLVAWNVRKTPLITNSNGARLPVPGHWAVIADDHDNRSVRVLGIVGRSNTPIQNEEHALLIMRILSLSEMRFLDAGSFGNGEHVFMVCAVPDKFAINAEDDDEQITGDFEMVSLNHHGGGALSFHIVRAGIWQSALRPLFLPEVSRRPGTGTIRERSLTSTRLRHNASRWGIATKLRNDLKLDLRGGGTLPTRPT